MSYQVLARKYRPQKFSEVIGQEHVTRTLQNAIEQGRTAHGYIFSGHRGIGKTTVARILAMALNCRSTDHPVAEPCGVCDSCIEIRAGNSVDVIEIDAATNRGIDEIRELREAARYRPARDRFKIYILDEAHQITDAAFNALLKTLEEPPGHVVFMLATTQPEDIPQTIRSRCQHFSFRAVRFEEILGQLRELMNREKLEADEDALAMLAEAGDGSMRDALSILDQAIASTNGRITAESVRQLVGSVPSAVLEDMMQAVARGSSEQVLRLADELISSGQNPAYFAKQLVRFLRNTLVAKIAGKDSHLLQISSDERTRAAGIAALFTEEDLARHLQIMLRTHNELGYKQEQRFHLELGLLKMAHAARLLPIEQLLSEAESSFSTANSKPVPRPTAVGETRTSTASPISRPNTVSPFAADSARKSGPKSELSLASPSESPRPTIASQATSPVIMGSAVAVAEPEPLNAIETRVLSPTAAAPLIVEPRHAEAQLSGPEIDDYDLPVPNPSSSSTAAQAREQAPSQLDEVRNAILHALSNANQRMVVTLLEAGEWKLEGNEIVVKVAASASMIDMSISADSKRVAIATASGVLGRAAKFKVLPGGTASTPAPRTPQAGGRTRAEEDPIVRRMQEKFGAEIRTIIDQREK
jgi:DNA polymerase-3 subunit gamma/tau